MERESKTDMRRGSSDYTDSEDEYLREIDSEEDMMETYVHSCEGTPPRTRKQRKVKEKGFEYNDAYSKIIKERPKKKDPFVIPSYLTNELWKKYFEEHNIIICLTDQNYEHIIRETELLLVMFYLACYSDSKDCYCGLSTFILTAEAMKTHYKVRFATCSYTEYTVRKKYAYYGLPQFSLFRNGKVIARFDGKRTPVELKRFLLHYALFSKNE